MAAGGADDEIPAGMWKNPPENPERNIGIGVGVKGACPIATFHKSINSTLHLLLLLLHLLLLYPPIIILFILSPSYAYGARFSSSQPPQQPSSILQHLQTRQASSEMAPSLTCSASAHPGDATRQSTTESIHTPPIPQPETE